MNGTPGRPPQPPLSPCIRVCRLGADGRCLGCLRTAEEIAAWPRLDDAHKRAVLADLPRRAAAVRG